MRKYLSILFIILLTNLGCKSHKEAFDASGNFEAEEVIVYSEMNGQLLNFPIKEGDSLSKDQVVGTIDAENLELQKEQVQASIDALSEKTSNATPQIAVLQNELRVQESQLDNLIHERKRTENLVKADAATGKQLDDINAQVDMVQKKISVIQQQMNALKNNTNTQNRSVLSERLPLKKRIAQLDQQLSKSQVKNPVGGIVLTKYAEQGEVTSPGKALYKIADLTYLDLRAYISGIQLSQVRLNQQVTVLVDNGSKGYRKYNGTINWISDKAEFTPKSIQTKEERANLVYAVKIRVKNDGYLKIGMYAEVDLQNKK